MSNDTYALYPGAKSAEILAGPYPTSVPFADIHSAFALQSHLLSLRRDDPHNVDRLLTVPPGLPPSYRSSFVYESLRIILMLLSDMLLALDGKCTPATCNQMCTGPNWVFLCAAHATPQPCPAIGYAVHTLDGSTALLQTPRYFPSRVQVSGEGMQLLTSMARRLMRICAHAFHHHRAEFDQFEKETSAAKWFCKLCIGFNLNSAEVLSVMSEFVDSLK